MSSIRDCFVTGKWEDDKDAAKLLEEDGMCKTCIDVYRILKKSMALQLECFALVINLQIFSTIT